MLVLHYPQCGTCRKALAWLKNHEFTPKLRHIVDERPTAAELEGWIPRSGLPTSKWFNTSGVLYKERGLKDVVKTATQEELIALLASEGKLVKRPVLVADDGTVLIGFKEEVWAAALLE